MAGVDPSFLFPAVDFDASASDHRRAQAGGDRAVVGEAPQIGETMTVDWPRFELGAEGRVELYPLGASPRLGHRGRERVEASAGFFLPLDPSTQFADDRNRHRAPTVASGNDGNVAGVDPPIEGGVAHADKVGGEIPRNGPAQVRFQLLADLTDCRIAAALLCIAKAGDPVQGPSSLLHGHSRKA